MLVIKLYEEFVKGTIKNPDSAVCSIATSQIWVWDLWGMTSLV